MRWDLQAWLLLLCVGLTACGQLVLPEAVRPGESAQGDGGDEVDAEPDPEPETLVGRAQTLSQVQQDSAERIVTLGNDGTLTALACTVDALTGLVESTPCACAAGICTVGVTPLAAFFGTASFEYVLTAGLVSSSAVEIEFPVENIPEIALAAPPDIDVDSRFAYPVEGTCDVEGDDVRVTLTHVTGDALALDAVSADFACTGGEFSGTIDDAYRLMDGSVDLSLAYASDAGTPLDGATVTKNSGCTGIFCAYNVRNDGSTWSDPGPAYIRSGYGSLVVSQNSRFTAFMTTRPFDIGYTPNGSVGQLVVRDRVLAVTYRYSVGDASPYKISNDGRLVVLTVLTGHSGSYTANSTTCDTPEIVDADSSGTIDTDEYVIGRRVLERDTDGEPLRWYFEPENSHCQEESFTHAQTIELRVRNLESGGSSAALVGAMDSTYSYQYSEATTAFSNSSTWDIPFGLLTNPELTRVAFLRWDSNGDASGDQSSFTNNSTDRLYAHAFSIDPTTAAATTLVNDLIKTGTMSDDLWAARASDPQISVAPSDLSSFIVRFQDMDAWGQPYYHGDRTQLGSASVVDNAWSYDLPGLYVEKRYTLTSAPTAWDYTVNDNGGTPVYFSANGSFDLPYMVVELPHDAPTTPTCYIHRISTSEGYKVDHWQGGGTCVCDADSCAITVPDTALYESSYMNAPIEIKVQLGTSGRYGPESTILAIPAISCTDSEPDSIDDVYGLPIGVGGCS